MPQQNKNTNKLTNVELSIQISLSGLSFSILQKDSNKISALKHFDFNKRLTPLELLDSCKNIFNTETDLQESFNNICVIHDNELSTLVPKPLFEEDSLADYLKFNSKILKTDFITYDEIVLNDSVNVYVPYININNFIYEEFGAFTFKHVSTILIEEILLIEKNNNTPKVYLNISKNHFEIVIIEKGKLLLYNTFEYTTKEDFIYYVLFTVEQLGLNPETLHLAFIGDINENDDLYQIAYKYIRNISFSKRNDDYNYDESPKYSHSDFTLIKSF
ncbi:DUF3822 family protein [Flavivirga amylovorans]|uniref:DUF3822 family protein n=1 Tax=Flavivirga amylovorans TaxID=870486 RepID=A0ABT8X2A0_9FLAO|nr:DUF3822 family protein [Flavivirga amylovorans]MDO5987700.1 DUF3822 family protein [Flavivirga amylovorans]